VQFIGRSVAIACPHTGLVTQDTRLSLVLGINLGMVLALLLVGLLAHSLGVLASAADYLGDALGAALSLVALRISRHEHGHPRATSYAALANSSFLLLVTLSVVAEAIHRLISGAPAIHGVPVVIVSVIAATAMVACAFILGDVEGDLSMESVMLDTVADAAAAIGVAVSGAVILITKGTYWLDSLVALLIALVVGFHAIRLMRKVVLDLRRKSVRQDAPARATSDI
jgi:cobalt-zinc-cadmium efflux system protein